MTPTRKPFSFVYLFSKFFLCFSVMLAAPDSLSGKAEAPVIPPKEGKSETIRLFNGENLDGWRGHDHYWSVQDGVIVGKNTDKVEVSTYLLTERTFSDFRLTGSAKLVESEMHSGFAMWGRNAPEHGDAFTYAGHLVMFPSDYGFYDLFGRAGLGVDGAPAKEVGHQHDWNDMEVLAQGNRIRFVLNGKLVADWRDPEPERIMEGPIGLQLHSNDVPQEIHFKHLVVTTFPSDRLITLNDGNFKGLTPKEIDEGWRLLFDGKTTEGWRAYKSEAFPEQGWKIEEGSIHKVAGAGGGDIITEEQFENFDFIFEWKVAPGANSGVFYRGAETDGPIYETAPEYQILDNERHRDGRNPETSAASLYALYPPQDAVLKPVGEYNEGRIRVQGDHVEHWVNGNKVVECEIGSDEWTNLVSNSKFSKWKKFGTVKKGHLGLQDHGDDVWYRNIKVRPL